MGCCSSKGNRRNRLSFLDDSLKVMTSRDAKRNLNKGQAVTGFVPRAPHPLLNGKKEHNGHSIVCEEPVGVFDDQSPKQEIKDNFTE